MHRRVAQTPPGVMTGSVRESTLHKYEYSATFRNNNAKADKKKIKAAAPTAEELDSELMKYMGNEQVAKTLDGELDEYFKSTETV